MCHKFEYDCPVKQTAREKALYWTKRKPAKVYFCLPARECLCVQTALAKGIIDKNTIILFIEKEHDDFDVIQNKLKSLGFTRFAGIYGEIKNCIDPWYLKTCYNRAIGKKYDTPTPKRFIDLAFIDICGEYTSSTRSWIQRNHQFFTRGATISLTTQTNPRSIQKEWYNHLSLIDTGVPDEIGGEYPGHSGNFCGDIYTTQLRQDIGVKNCWFTSRFFYKSPGKSYRMMVSTLQIL